MALSQSRLSADCAVSFYVLDLSSCPRLSALSEDMLVEWPSLEPMASHFCQRHFPVDSIETMYGPSQYDCHQGSPMVTSTSIYWAVEGRHQWFG